MVFTKVEALKKLKQIARDSKLQKFYPDGDTRLDEIASEAEKRLADWRRRAAHLDILKNPGEKEEYAYSMLRLSLYKIHNTARGSMYQDDRIDTARTVMRAVVNLDTAIVKEGIQLHFLNETDSASGIKSYQDFDTAWDKVSFGGPTRLGTVIKEKIWSKILGDEAQFKQPGLIYMFTDGEPVGEPRTRLAESIKECKAQLTSKQYEANAIAFGIVQIGNDLEARKFLDSLAQDKTVNDHLEVINQDEAIENKWRQSKGKSDLEESAVILEMLVGAINRAMKNL